VGLGQRSFVEGTTIMPALAVICRSRDGSHLGEGVIYANEEGGEGGQAKG